MKKIILNSIALLTSILLWSQQDAQYTQYMYNMSVINPAYTTDAAGIINIGGLYRTQWIGVIGAPKSSNLFLHTPINDKIEIGFSLINDNIGDIVKENNVSFDFAYKLDLEEHGNLSFGLKTGVTFFDVNFNDFELESGDVFTDADFSNNINQSFFNIGAGLYFNTDHYYLGISIPNILKSQHLNRNNGKYQGTELPHIFLTSGYVFEINDFIKLKPAFMLKGVNGAPLTLDLTANILYDNRLEFGIGYRFNDAFTGLFNIRATPELRIGYAYDYTTSNLGPFSSGSHELFILYDFDIYKLNKGFDISPRFF
ncbi:type IX secretion system PorP/SprF family membrane protein [Lutibacter oceani]|uniref:Type IX secretion system PorP/SprF family membrane protein n=1 Tax=Lutibacter oceani TaxID=1853311 RepID=A0A3D9RL29_9FLAO|nr:type IX secretion system membrane protein PorP/SprF [Lutibacter oceani]REE80467.1 type IX secretion system PorP/SprF family membrane protein [Lutibacter oceani]